MFSLDKAISIYTDQLNANEAIDVNFFMQNLQDYDFSEFVKLAKLLNVMVETKERDRAASMFLELDQYKNEIYSSQTVANFKLDKISKADEDDIDEIDRLFQEEFGDD